MNMQHHFDIEIAEAYGLNEAIILNNIRFWVIHNEANGANFHDGRFWTYNSMKAFETLFPYMKPKTIRNALEKLETEGLILTGNYNKVSFDRTKWYTLSDKGYALFQQVAPICPTGQMDSPYKANRIAPTVNSISPTGQMDSTLETNGIARRGEPIPDRKPDGKTTDETSDGKPDVKRTYGRYGNVKLTDTDLSKLKTEFPGDWRERIDRLSTYMDSTGKSYVNHLATIRRWAHEDAERSRAVGSPAPENRAAPSAAPARPTIEAIMEKHGVDYMTANEMLFDGTY